MCGDPIGVMVIDDNGLVGEALGRWATRQPALRWLGWAADRASAAAMVAEHRPDVVLLDIDMPGVDTFALVGELKAQWSGVHVVMFSGHVREEFIDRAADAGASGYIIKDEPPREILALAQRAAGGEFVLSETARTLGRGRARPPA